MKLQEKWVWVAPAGGGSVACLVDGVTAGGASVVSASPFTRPLLRFSLPSVPRADLGLTSQGSRLWSRPAGVGAGGGPRPVPEFV